MGNMLKNKEEIWAYVELSRHLPDIEMIIKVAADLELFVVEGLSCDLKETVKAVFPAPSIVTYRTMKRNDTYNFSPEEQDDAGFLSVSDNSSFLEWYRDVRLFNTDKDNIMAKLRSYKISTDSDVMEVISFAPPKVYYSPDLVVEEEKKDGK